MIQLRVLALRTITAAATIASLVIALFTLWYGRTLFLLIFAGILFAILLRAASSFLHERTGLPIKWSLAAVVLCLCILIAAAAMWMGPNIADQVDEFLSTLPDSLEPVKAWLGSHGLGRRFLQDVAPSGASRLQIDDLLSRVGGLFSQSSSFITHVFVVVALGIFIAAEPQIYLRTFVRLFPKGSREAVERVLEEVAGVLRRWLVARLIAMTLVGTLTALGLWALGIPLALTLAVIAMLLGFIPNLGPVLAAIPAVLIALLQSPAKAMYVVLLYVGIQTVEGYLITPLLQRKAISMPPALLISFQILAGVLFGFLGLLLATPLCAAALVLTHRVYIEGVLQDRSSEPFPPAG